MDLNEQAQLVALAREFSEGELRPNVESWEAARALPADLMRSLAETGFLGMLLPEEYDGLGLDTGTYAEILEAIAWADPLGGPDRSGARNRRPCGAPKRK